MDHMNVEKVPERAYEQPGAEIPEDDKSTKPLRTNVARGP